MKGYRGPVYIPLAVAVIYDDGYGDAGDIDDGVSSL